MIALLGGVLSDDLLNEVAGKKIDGPLSMLHSAGTARWRDKHMLFLAEADAQQPFALVKWGRGAWAKGLVSEQAATTQVRATADPALVASCPPSWGPFEEGADTVVTIERYYPSQSVYSQLRVSLWPRRLVDEHFRRVLSWLTHFAAATGQRRYAPKRPLDEALLEEYIIAPLRMFTERFANDVVPHEAIDRIIGTARAHLGEPVPFTAEHGDLWPSNVLLPRSQAKGIYVVDWEHYRPVSLGGFDMLFFCTTYSRDFPWQPMRWMDYEVALARTYMQRNWLTDRIARLLGSYCEATGLPRTLLPALLPVVMARVAIRQADSEPEWVANPEEYWRIALRAWCRRPAHSWLDAWANAK